MRRRRAGARAVPRAREQAGNPARQKRRRTRRPRPSRGRRLRAAPAGRRPPAQVVGTSFLGGAVESGSCPPTAWATSAPRCWSSSTGASRCSPGRDLGGLNTTTNNFFASVGGATNGTSDPHVRYDRLERALVPVIITVANCPNESCSRSARDPISSQSSFTFFRFQREAGASSTTTRWGWTASRSTSAATCSCAHPFKSIHGAVVREQGSSSGTLAVTPFRGLIDFTKRGRHLHAAGREQRRSPGHRGRLRGRGRVRLRRAGANHVNNRRAARPRVGPEHPGGALDGRGPSPGQPSGPRSTRSRTACSRPGAHERVTGA